MYPLFMESSGYAHYRHGDGVELMGQWPWGQSIWLAVYLGQKLDAMGLTCSLFLLF